MDTSRVLYFLEILNRETSGHANEITNLYERALDENDDISRLKTLLYDDYTYYREAGNALYKNGDRLLESVYSMPTKSLEILPLLKQARESIENEVRICYELMYSPRPFSETITVLKKKDTISYLLALKAIASCCVYLIILYAGLDPIKGLTWNDAAGIQESIYAVNKKFLPALCEVRRPNYCWVIRKRRLGGRALIGGEAFYLSFENKRSVENLCSSLHKEAIGTHAYLNIDAYESGGCDIPYCWGTGNIISASPDNALQFLQSDSDIVTKLRAPQAAELNRNVPTPFECVKQLSNDMLFCVSPDDLLLAMNQWQVGHEIEERKRTHNCLFCGRKVVENKLVCSSHFAME